MNSNHEYSCVTNIVCFHIRNYYYGRVSQCVRVCVCCRRLHSKLRTMTMRQCEKQSKITGDQTEICRHWLCIFGARACSHSERIGHVLVHEYITIHRTRNGVKPFVSHFDWKPFWFRSFVWRKQMARLRRRDEPTRQHDRRNYHIHLSDVAIYLFGFSMFDGESIADLMPSNLHAVVSYQLFVLFIWHKLCPFLCSAAPSSSSWWGFENVVNRSSGPIWESTVSTVSRQEFFFKSS